LHHIAKQKDEGKTKASKAPSQCGQCEFSCGQGQLHAKLEGEIWDKLVMPKKGSPQLQHLKPNQVCSVPEELCEPGFPLNQGEKMPMPKRARKEQMVVWECSLKMAKVQARWIVVKGSRKQAAQGGLLSKIVNSHFKLHCEQWSHRQWDDAAQKMIVCVLVCLVTKMQRACCLCVSCFSRNRVLHLNFINSFHSGCKRCFI
jgi:hypothetical protein